MLSGVGTRPVRRFKVGSGKVGLQTGMRGCRIEPVDTPAASEVLAGGFCGVFRSTAVTEGPAGLLWVRQNGRIGAAQGFRDCLRLPSQKDSASIFSRSFRIKHCASVSAPSNTFCFTWGVLGLLE